jgi:ribosomal-protein-alanine N-acetyltransferase
VTVGSVVSSLGRVRLVGDVTTPRLYGRPPVEEDLEDSVRIWTDPRVAEQAWPARLRTASDASRVLHASIAHWDRWGFGPWTVIERATRAVVGRVGPAHTRVASNQEVEVAWFLSADVWGRGYATEMAREAVRVGFSLLGLSDLVSFTTPPNAASQAVMRKLGFRYERDIEHAGLTHVLFRLPAGTWASPPSQKRTV